ncbi:IS1249 family transposase [Arcanobacterium bovis]|uniref:IS1249 family transposase n=1 Tax=Arcanobacterium bovis TaxID=2529275 RepID=UPI003616158C
MRKRSIRARRCPLCQSVMKKNGKNKSGTQRWYCPDCRYSSTSRDYRQQRQRQFRQFLAYVTDTAPRRVQGSSLRTWDRDHAWCWHTRPAWQVTGEVYDQVFIDGTYIPYGWCILIASTTKGVITYQVCQRENKASYTALLSRIPAPIVVVTDGDKGALGAIRQCWPEARIQRCLVHIQRNIRRVTTINPKTDQHKALHQLGRDLTRINTAEHAITWIKALAAFHQLYDDWLEEKTYRTDMSISDIPTFARNNKKWWYTHYQTRRIIKSLDRYVKDQVLFTYLRDDLDTTTVLASTTNKLEGGINSPLKAFLHAHRGWSEEHMLTAINYWLYTNSIDPKPLESFIDNITQPPKQPVQEEQPGPVEIDTAINTQAPWEDGLHIQKSWTGR